jgi:hypothetical protein
MCALRDYSQDCQDLITNRDSALVPGDLQLWQDSIPVQNCINASLDEIDILTTTSEQLKLESLDHEFEADVLRLARDAAAFGQLLAEQKRHDRAVRASLLLHLKEQNQVGVQIVSEWMRKNCRHILGPLDKSDPHVASYELGKAHANTLVWVDFTKCGRLSQHFLGSSIDFVRRILGRDASKSAAFVIAPVLTSEKCPTLRMEHRLGLKWHRLSRRAEMQRGED